MSHVAKVDLLVTSLDDLEAACAKLMCTFDPNARTWKYYGRWVNDYHAEDAAYQHGIDPKRYGTSDAGVITVPGCSWQIGVYRNPKQEGTFVLCYDFFGSQGDAIHKVCGKGLSALKAEYGGIVASRQLRKKGFRCVEERNEQGRLLKLKATR